jgi:hypothetical protein
VTTVVTTTVVTTAAVVTVVLVTVVLVTVAVAAQLLLLLSMTPSTRNEQWQEQKEKVKEE